MIEWIVQHLYLVAVIVFALLSFLGKASQGKENKRRGSGGMPTFGGPAEGFPSRGKKRNDGDKPQPQYTVPDKDFSEQGYDEIEPARGMARNAARDDLDEGVSVEYADAESTLEGRIRAMEEERQRVLQRLDRISGGDMAVYGEDDRGTEGRSRFRTSDIRSGMIWSEILSPPKAKRRRRGV
ncbi:hypothetical protein [Paenibacillus medicaginis]|uniref:Conjugate transposon protein n=1 Tax=Paenibacillus medicaginis TaxID=1470560 RepID=A0ABV5BVE7_9BACL